MVNTRTLHSWLKSVDNAFVYSSLNVLECSEGSKTVHARTVWWLLDCNSWAEFSFLCVTINVSKILEKPWKNSSVRSTPWDNTFSSCGWLQTVLSDFIFNHSVTRGLFFLVRRGPQRASRIVIGRTARAPPSWDSQCCQFYRLQPAMAAHPIQYSRGNPATLSSLTKPVNL